MALATGMPWSKMGTLSAHINNNLMIERHALQILQPIDDEGELQCIWTRHSRREAWTDAASRKGNLLSDSDYDIIVTISKTPVTFGILLQSSITHMHICLLVPLASSRIEHHTLLDPRNLTP